ncbi:MAG: O-antigen ligase family protein [Candidatus Omnitrophota bacterium]
MIPDKINSTIRFFLYLLIFWLPYSIAVVESCVIVAVILWVIKRTVLFLAEFRRKSFFSTIRDIFRSYAPRENFLNKPIFFYLAVCLLSALTSQYSSQALRGFLTKTLEWFVVFFLCVEVITRKRHIAILTAIFLFTAFATALDGLIQFYITHQDVIYGHALAPGAMRVTAAFKHSNSLGAFLAMVVPMNLSVVVMKWNDKKIRVMSFFSLLIAAWVLVLTFSRGAWLGVAGGLVLFLFFRHRRLLTGAMAILALAAVAFYVFMPGTFQKSMDSLFYSRQQTVDFRLGVWQDSLKVIERRPFLGNGPNTYMDLFQKYRRKHNDWDDYSPTYAHNSYVQMAAEVGAIGLMGFLWILFSLFRNFSREILRVKADRDGIRIFNLGCLSAITAFLVHSFFDSNLYSLQLSVCFWFIIGLLMAGHLLLKKDVICGIKTLQT